jgi:cell division protein FtsB
MRKEHMLLVVIAVQAAAIVGLMFGEARQAAVAQIPDQGAQLQKVIDETKQVNAKLDRIVTILESGKLQVKVAEPEAK